MCSKYLNPNERQTIRAYKPLDVSRGNGENMDGVGRYTADTFIIETNEQTIESKDKRGDYHILNF